MEEYTRPSTGPQNNPFDPRRQYGYVPSANRQYSQNVGIRPHHHAVSQPRTWARKLSKWELVKHFIRHNFAYIVCGVLVAASLITILILLAGFLHRSSTTPVAVKQPATASQVASQLNCKGFKDLGSAPAAGVVDSGSCYIGKVKYAMNTFANSNVRDAWIKMSAPFGVVPKWETPTSVTYKSVTN